MSWENFFRIQTGAMKCFACVFRPLLLLIQAFFLITWSNNISVSTWKYLWSYRVYALGINNFIVKQKWRNERKKKLRQANTIFSKKKIQFWSHFMDFMLPNITWWIARACLFITLYENRLNNKLKAFTIHQGWYCDSSSKTIPKI